MKEEILRLLRDKGEMPVSRISDTLGISRQMVHRILNQLLTENQIEKLGRAPRTFYKIAKIDKVDILSVSISNEVDHFLKDHFLLITETGQRLDGIDAFVVWCKKQNLPLEKTIDEFVKTRKKYLAYKDNNGLISGIQKLKNTKGFSAIGTDELYYQDFYAIERFGKTRLGQLLHFAKQGQNKSMMREISSEIKPYVDSLIRERGIDAIGYIPPTIKRDVQIMKVLENELKLDRPILGIIKVKGDVVVPQKSLSRIDERIQNAQASIMVNERRSFDKVLLIDDAVGSGATINETALKLKSKGVAQYVIGYAVTGSFKGFDVITEV